MAKREIYTCDRCGKQENKQEALRWAGLVLPVHDPFDDYTHDPFDDYTHEAFDLCPVCQLELALLLKHHFMAWDGKKYAIKDAPYADIARLETELEEATQDIIELEEELERLRDVKDSLFETNFLLTERLIALGVEVVE